MPISVILWVTGQAVEQEVNPALDKADSQMKCLIAKGTEIKSCGARDLLCCEIPAVHVLHLSLLALVSGVRGIDLASQHLPPTANIFTCQGS